MVATDRYRGLVAETISIPAAGGDLVHAYRARPTGPGPFPAVLLFHHLPGWDDWYHHATRVFADRGYMAVCPDLYCRDGHGDPDDVAARVRAEGGAADDQVVADAAEAVAFVRAQPTTTGKIGYFGTCSGGRHAYLAACRGPAVDALVDCWGGGIVAGDDELTGRQPVAPVDYTGQLPCPVLGLFGNRDHHPTPEQVDTLEETLSSHDKHYEFHRYGGAGHGFFYHDRPAAYHAEAAVDGWAKVFDFLDRTLRADDLQPQHR